jgi:anti-sigma factor RsiW
MNCADLEVLLTDYLEGALRHEQSSAVECHLNECALCRELAEDASSALAFMERAATVEPPPELVTRILYEITSGPSQALVKPSWVRRLFGKRLEAVLQPKYVMGMAMTVLSFAMVGRSSGLEVRQLSLSDLNPVKVWMAAEDRVDRAWDRSIKYYESMPLVFEVQRQLNEWTDEQATTADAKNSPADNGAEFR